MRTTGPRGVKLASRSLMGSSNLDASKWCILTISTRDPSWGVQTTSCFQTEFILCCSRSLMGSSNSTKAELASENWTGR